MSKKKNKKKGAKSRYYTKYSLAKNDVKKNKNKKKAVEKAYDAPRLKRVKPTLGKKEMKQNHKIVTAPIEIAKAFRKNREQCNHANGLMSVNSFKAMTPAYAAFTPMLDRLCREYGQDNVKICRTCYDAMVSIDSVRADEAVKAINTLYAVANIVLATKRMKDEEVENLNKMKESLEKWDDTISSFIELKNSRMETPKPAAEATDEEKVAAARKALNDLNKVTGAY